jgi:hypothetical protein
MPDSMLYSIVSEEGTKGIMKEVTTSWFSIDTKRDKKERVEVETELRVGTESKAVEIGI